MASSQPEHAIKSRGIDPRKQSGTCVILSPQSSQNLIRKAFLEYSSQNFKQSGGDKHFISICTYKKKKVIATSFIFSINQVEIVLLFYVTK